MNDKQDKLGDFLLEKTEQLLTWRKQHKLLAREKAKQKGFLLDLLTSIPGTLLIVFILNLYFIQAYVIPSGSMENTLLIKDRILVDKFHYGPELWLGVDKHLPAIKPVVRGQIITFPNPEYESRGAFFETARRILFYITLTALDIGKDANGNPPVDLLIKRAVGYDGDRIIFRDGNIYIKAEGERSYLAEPHFKFISDLNYETKRIFSQEDSELVELLAQFFTYRGYGLPIPAHLQRVQSIFGQEQGRYMDRIDYANPYPRTIARMMISPQRQKNIDDYYFFNRGIYVPHGYVLPLGDNRDNSHDGRYFGVVEQRLVQGKAIWRIWPMFQRWGALE